MSEVIKMDFAAMEELIGTFKQAVQSLEETIQAEQKMADELEGGVLLGDAGVALTNAIRSPLTKSTKKLLDKFNDLIADCYGALVDLRDGDSEAASRFKG